MPARSGRVHVATTERHYKGKIYRTHLLRRTYRVGRQVKHETLGNISHLPDALIELIRRSLAGEAFLPVTEAFAIERSLPHGHVQAVLGMIGQLGLETLIGSKRCRQRDLVVAMIAERLLHPGSKLATTRSWHSTTLAEQLAVGDAAEDELYDALDWLLARQSRIEKKLAHQHLSEGAVVLYDVTSSYYEGHCCPLAKFGHNRDNNKDRPIIVYGALTDAEGRPLAVEVYEGNTGDPTTVPAQVEKLRARFGLKRVVLVGDRGTLTETQIGKLKQHPGLGWVSALKVGAIRELADTGALQLSLFDEQNLAEIRSPAYPGERLMACYNPLLAEERKRKRGELLEATEKELTRIGKEVARRKRKLLGNDEIALKVGAVRNRFKVGKHFELTIEDGLLRWSRRVESIRREAELDGIYVIRTSEDGACWSAADTVRRYKSLAQVERVFRTLKGIELRVRPIFHRTADHVRAHIFLCLLAYYVEWHMRQLLAPVLFDDDDKATGEKLRASVVAPAQRSPRALKKAATKRCQDGTLVHSFRTLLADLATVANTQIKPSCLDVEPFNRVSMPTPTQQKAFDLLQVSPFRV
jgi:transposase